MSGDLVASLLADLRGRDVRLELCGDRIHIDAPRGVVSDADREALQSIKEQVRERLEFESGVLDMSFDELGQARIAIEIAVPWYDQHLWLVPDAQFAAELVSRGVPRGCIWTAGELRDLYRIDTLQQADRIKIAKLKAQFGAEVLGVESSDDDEAKHVNRSRPCSGCRGTKYWRSVHGTVVCARCHPPAKPDLVAGWVDCSVEANP